MVKIERTYPYFCCNSCGKQNSETFPVWKVKVGIDGSKQTTSISLCNECLKKLKTEIKKKQIVYFIGGINVWERT